MFKRKKSYRFYRGKAKKKVGWWTHLISKLLWLAIGFVSVLLLIYALSFYQRLSQPEASEFSSKGKESNKQILVRVQIINGSSISQLSGGEDLAQRLTKKLNQLHVDNLIYEIVEVQKSELGKMGLKDSEAKESMIIDRWGDEKTGEPSKIALLTAKALNIDPQNVVFQKLKNNYQDVSLTILIGNDYKSLFSTDSKK